MLIGRDRPMLIGREPELIELNALLDRATRHRGGALVLRGAAGAGKSALLAAATAEARGRGLTVHATTGYEAETNIAFAGLHSLLLTMDADGCTPSAGEVVLAAVGRGGQDDGPRRVAHVALAALTAVQGDGAVLVVVDDAQWLDQPSWDALRSMARRLRHAPVAVVMAIREGALAARRLAGADLPELAVGPLTAHSARELLDKFEPGLPATTRARVLAVACGNPLALREFGRAATRNGAGGPMPGTLPLSAKVERTFAALVAALPEPTALLLRVAAIADRDDLREILRAAALVSGRRLPASHLRPAVEAALVLQVSGRRLQFRHPLMRSALRCIVGLAESVRIHAALAQVLAEDPQRSVWHRASATTGPDDALARELSALADRAVARGDRETAVYVLRRAAALSTDEADRAGRLLAAAIRLVELGNLREAVRQLEQVDESALRMPDRARLSWLREESLGGGWSGAARVTTFAETADAVRAAGDDRLALQILQPMGMRSFWANPGASTRAALLAVLDRIVVPPSDPRMLALVARVAPVERGPAVLARLAEARESADTPEARYHVALAAVGVGAFDVAAPLLESAVDGLRQRGNRSTAAQALMSQAWVAAQLGQVRTGLVAAIECRGLGQELGLARWMVAVAQAEQAQLEALRGNGAEALRLADESERVLLPAGAGPLLALVALARGVAALADGRPGDAWHQLSQVFDPAGLAFHPHVRGHALGLLAESAVASGHRDELSAIVDDLQSLADACPSPVLLRTLAYARAVLAPAGDAEALFLHALGAGLDDWTFERARLQLAYGAWLRRHRRPAASRELLRSASKAFDALGVAPWADRARRELAASGASPRRRVDQNDALTPQEQQIAQLAAQGLSNREIAERLSVSPRTVSTHLYRVYPKLGVTTRTELRRALDQ